MYLKERITHELMRGSIISEIVLFCFVITYCEIYSRYAKSHRPYIRDSINNLYKLIKVEKFLLIFYEENIQIKLSLSSTTKCYYINSFYIIFVPFVTLATLLYLYTFKPHRYIETRNALLLVNILEVTSYLIFPYYPPRYISKCTSRISFLFFCHFTFLNQSYFLDICDLKYKFIDTIHSYGFKYNIDVIFYIYIYKVPSVLYSWIIWCVWALFPLFDSIYVKISLVLLIIITILFTFIMAYDFILCMIIFISLSFIIQHIYDIKTNL